MAIAALFDPLSLAYRAYRDSTRPPAVGLPPAVAATLVANEAEVMQHLEGREPLALGHLNHGVRRSHGLGVGIPVAALKVLHDLGLSAAPIEQALRATLPDIVSAGLNEKDRAAWIPPHIQPQTDLPDLGVLTRYIDWDGSVVNADHVPSAWAELWPQAVASALQVVYPGLLRKFECTRRSQQVALPAARALTLINPVLADAFFHADHRMHAAVRAGQRERLILWQQRLGYSLAAIAYPLAQLYLQRWLWRSTMPTHHLLAAMGCLYAMVFVFIIPSPYIVCEILDGFDATRQTRSRIDEHAETALEAQRERGLPKALLQRHVAQWYDAHGLDAWLPQPHLRQPIDAIATLGTDLRALFWDAAGDGPAPAASDARAAERAWRWHLFPPQSIALEPIEAAR